MCAPAAILTGGGYNLTFGEGFNPVGFSGCGARLRLAFGVFSTLFASCVVATPVPVERVRELAGGIASSVEVSSASGAALRLAQAVPAGETKVSAVASTNSDETAFYVIDRGSAGGFVVLSCPQTTVLPLSLSLPPRDVSTPRLARRSTTSSVAMSNGVLPERKRNAHRVRTPGVRFWKRTIRAHCRVPMRALPRFPTSASNRSSSPGGTSRPSAARRSITTIRRTTTSAAASRRRVRRSCATTAIPTER